MSNARAQEIEPRAYSNAPVGVNFLAAGYVYTQGGLALDPSLPVENPRLKTSNAVFAYARVLDIWGNTGKFDVIVPYTSVSGSVVFDGEFLQRKVDGFADPKLRLSVNLFGAPALKLSEFTDYKQDLIVGVSLQISVPLGQYDSGRVVNIGTNRWSFKPEVGVSKAIGSWTFEVAAGITLYTDNKEYIGGRIRSQKPLYSLQSHVSYGFRSGAWVSMDVIYFEGARTTISGDINNDLQRNWRLGGTLAIPLNFRNSIKLNASSGVSTRTGNNYRQLGIAWQHRFGGGL